VLAFAKTTPASADTVAVIDAETFQVLPLVRITVPGPRT
jgi:hypothetical protein